MSRRPAIEPVAPIVLVRKVATREVVVATCERARSRAIRVGMTLPQARAIDASILWFEHDPARDAHKLDALARWAFRFTPVVEIVGPSRDDAAPSFPSAAGGSRLARASRFCQGERLRFEGASAHPRKQLRVRSRSPVSHESSHALLLDLTGTERLFGPPIRTLRRIRDALVRVGITPRCALACTPGLAWARTFLEPGSRQIPVHALRLPADVVDTLGHLGVFTLERLRMLPRDQLPARFGAGILHRLDQLDGVIHEPLVPVEPFRPVRFGRAWEDPVESVECLTGIIDEVVERTGAELRRRGRGALLLRWTLRRHHAGPITRELRLARPAREPKTIRRLIDLSLESAVEAPRVAPERSRPLDAADGFCARAGFVGFTIDVPTSAPLPHDQATLADHEIADLADEADRLAEQLCARAGESAVRRVVARQSYLPERAWEEVDIASEPTPRPSDAAPTTPKDRAARGRKPLGDVGALFQSVGQSPLCLMPPREVRVVVSPSHDRDGRPIQIVIGRSSLRVLHAVGPHRIAGEWWRGHDKTRDYFDVETDPPARLWLFRVCESHRWFVHGFF